MISTDIQQQISELIEDEFAKLNLPDQPYSLYEPVRYTLALGGKRIRPYFTLTGCGLCNGEIEDAIPAAIAIELLHNFTLLHDDIMDSAATRRGEPSVFKKWNASRAILSGDAMYAWAFEQLQQYGWDDAFSKSQYRHILDIFLDSAKTVCEGQAYDLDFEEENSVSLDEYIQMIRGKTAALIEGAFKMGGVAAGAGNNAVELLEAIGKHTGIAFQIQDDLLDVIADPDKFGKKLGGDILTGKKTYLSILSLQKGSSAQVDEIRRIFKSSNVTNAEIESVINIYKELGVLDIAKTTLQDHYNRAIEKVNSFDHSPYQTDLVKFLTNLKNREF